jgi:hypothetical protein
VAGRCDVLIRSYWKDLDWLELCLASIDRYCWGFGQVIVVVPRSTEPWLRRTDIARQATVVLCADYPDDYLGQQVTKLLADTMTGADLVCHVDSDCMFSCPTSPDDLLDDGRPRIAYLPSGALDRHHPWRRPTERFLGWPIEHDFMQQPPFVYPRWLYSALREHTVRRHGMDIETYVTAQAPRAFSEFNVLGAYAWRHHRDEFSWVDARTLEPDRQRCRWYWSWGGIDSAIRADAATLLTGRNP